MSLGERKFWGVGDENIFRLSKDRCQDFVKALLICDGKIHDLFSLDVSHGEIKYNMKPHMVAAVFRISLPVGMEEKFESIMGKGWLEEPPQIQMN